MSYLTHDTAFQTDGYYTRSHKRNKNPYFIRWRSRQAQPSPDHRPFLVITHIRSCLIVLRTRFATTSQSYISLQVCMLCLPLHHFFLGQRHRIIGMHPIHRFLVLALTYFSAFPCALDLDVYWLSEHCCSKSRCRGMPFVRKRNSWLSFTIKLEIDGLLVNAYTQRAELDLQHRQVRGGRRLVKARGSLIAGLWHTCRSFVV